MKHLLRIADLLPAELEHLLDLATSWKASPRGYSGVGAGRVAAVLMEKPSLRTRFSIEGALARIGAQAIAAGDAEVQLGRREPIADVARVLSTYVDAIVLRTFGHERVVELASHASVPVINALSDDHHPLQALADLLTIREHFGRLDGIKVAYVGDGNNVANSLIESAPLTGIEVVCAVPEGREPSAGGTITHDPAEAVRGADVVYADVWVSMGDSVDDAHSVFAPYQVSGELMSAASSDAIFLHCLPAHRGEEVTSEVIDGPQSRVIEQAANRMTTAAAVFISAWR